MIAAAFGVNPSSIAVRMARSLGLFAGAPAACHTTNDAAWCQLAAPRTARTLIPENWQSGRPTVAAGGSDRPIRWSIEPTGRIWQNVCTCRRPAAMRRYTELQSNAGARMPTGRLSVVTRQSAWTLTTEFYLPAHPGTHRPLFWAHCEGRILAASIPRPLFAAGLPKRLKPGTLAEILYGIENPDGGYWWEAMHAVPHGSISKLH